MRLTASRFLISAAALMTAAALPGCSASSTASHAHHAAQEPTASPAAAAPSGNAAVCRDFGQISGKLNGDLDALDGGYSLTTGIARTLRADSKLMAAWANSAKPKVNSSDLIFLPLELTTASDELSIIDSGGASGDVPQAQTDLAGASTDCTQILSGAG
jgi:hypothetical protein